MDDRQIPDGRRSGDSRTMWPMYVMVTLSLLTVVWGAAANVASAAATRETVAEMRQQLYQMQATGASLRSAVDVLNCKTGITCRSDGGN